MLNRREFIRGGILAGAGTCLIPALLNARNREIVMTVSGPIHPGDLRFTLIHEHILVDFIGAGKTSPDRYHAQEVFNTALPFLDAVKKKGCSTIVECTPAYLGRDVQLVRRLSLASGITMITNTGYYGALGEKYLPEHVYSETAQQIASRWIKEWTDGIEGTGIRPGFIKIGVDKAPLSPALRKIVEAAAITHLATGLTIGIHTGDGEAAKEELEILKIRGVSPAARIWIHAQNEKNDLYHVQAGHQGSWVSFDGVGSETIEAHVGYLQTMKREKLLERVLVSQDTGWYHVGEPDGGNYKDYNCIFTQFIPALQQNGFTQREIDTIFVHNPAKAFAIKVRKS